MDVPLTDSRDSHNGTAALGRFFLGWLVAVPAATLGGTVAFIASAMLRGSSGALGELPSVLALAAMFSVAGTTLLGPLTLWILVATGHESRIALLLGGAFAGLAGMVAVNALGGYPQDNLLPESGTVAGAFAAAAFSVFWLRRGRSA